MINPLLDGGGFVGRFWDDAVAVGEPTSKPVHNLHEVGTGCGYSIVGHNA